MGGERFNKSNARNEHDIPLSLLQPRLLQSLKVDDLLLDFPVRVCGQVPCGCHAPPRLAHTGECWACDELAQEAAARLASCTEDERGFRGCGYRRHLVFTVSCVFHDETHRTSFVDVASSS
jgi:hypothetical protein